MAIGTPTYQATSGTTGLICTITKPTSLAVGDIMVAHINFNLVSSETAVTPPSGWTELEYTPATDVTSYTAYKVADSSDVAASNFSFTSDGSGVNTANIGAIVRVPTARVVQVATQKSENAGTSTSPSTGTLTPPQANSLVLFFIANERSGSSNTVSSYAMATSNPTWTELYQASAHPVSLYITIACAYALRTTTTATGTISATQANSNPWATTAVILEPRMESSLSDTVTLSDAKLGSLSFNQSDTLTMNDAIVLSQNVIITNESKSTTTWTNQEKS